MKKKKWMIISAIALLVVAAGIVLFIVFGNRTCEYEDLGNLNYIKFSNGDEEYELVRKEECWYWKDREDLMLNESAIEAQVKCAKKELRVEKLEDKGSLKKYGLKDAEYSLTLKDTKGRKITMYVGDMLGADAYFVRVGDSKAIYSASFKIMDVIDGLSAERSISEQMEFIGEQ